ncbi:hypothetical protein N7453_001918 [Penicillium expansum]|nr:hypothetical protein N7453_001918 [Penicillium expansum]
MAVASISTPFDCTLPSSSSGSSIKKPIKAVSKPCFGCDCGDEEHTKYTMYPASNASDDQPRTRTARACDSCYKRKVDLFFSNPRPHR